MMSVCFRLSISGDLFSLVNVETGERIFSLPSNPAIAINLSSTLIAVSGKGVNGSVSIRDLISGKEVGSLTIKDVEAASNLLFSPNGTMLVAEYVLGAGFGKEHSEVSIWSKP